MSAASRPSAGSASRAADALGQASERYREALIDLTVYAPIGLAYEVKELLPKLTARGKGQVAMVRLVGGVAARKGRDELGRLINRAAGNVASGGTAMRQSAGGGSTATNRADDDELPFDGYDDLPASEIVARLGSLAADDRDRVERYERAHRARVTVLGKIDRLRG